MKKNTWDTQAVVAISGIWFLFGMAVMKWGYAVWRWIAG